LKIIIIVAIAENGVIGKANGDLPWQVKEDFRHFKNTTLGYPIVMGRKSFEALGKPLKGRENIVITHNKNLSYNFENIRIFYSLDSAIDYCKTLNKEKIFITGGGEIYKQAISFADEMIISHMKFEAEGEVKFPEFDINKWEIISKDEREKFVIVTYSRKI
jgi:dihydrofolate reductase